MRAAGGREDTDRGQEAQVCPAARLHWEGAGAQGSRTPESPRTGRQWEEEVARLTNKSTRQLPADVRRDSCASALCPWHYAPFRDPLTYGTISLGLEAGPRVLNVRGRTRAPAFRG